MEMESRVERKLEYNGQNALTARILNLYYKENCNQAEIAKRLGLSPAKVNRLLKTAREAGMVEVNIRVPFQNVFELESRLTTASGVEKIIVTPALEDSPEGDPGLLAQVAADYLVSQVRPRDAICIGGGRTLAEIIAHLEPCSISGVRVFPAIGGVQRNYDRDINGLANQLAQKLGGEAIQLFAPAFVETEAERDTVLGLTHVARGLEQARSARMGIFGIGSLRIDSSYLQYFPLSYRQLSELVERHNGVGEIIGYVIDSEGRVCIPELSKHVIGITMDDLRNIPVRIGVAAGASKASAIAAAIRGKYFNTLILDENAAREVFKILGSD